jgi:hypothetical protein
VKGLTSSQTITLTVEGITGGVSDLAVGWGVFTNPEAATTAGQFTIGSSAGMGIACYGVGVTISPAGDVNTNPLLQKEVTATDSSVSATLVQLETLNVYAGVNIPGNPTAYETYQITFHCGGGRLWADANRTSEILTGVAMAMTNPDAAFTIYVESISGGSTQVSVDLASMDSAIAEEYGGDHKTYTTTWEWVNGRLEQIPEKLEEGAKDLVASETKSELDKNVFGPLSVRIKNEIKNLKASPNSDDWTKAARCEEALNALNQCCKEAANSAGDLAFDSVKFSLNFLLPTTEAEAHPYNDVLKSTFENPNPAIEKPSLHLSCSWKSIGDITSDATFVSLWQDVKSGRSGALAGFENWIKDLSHYLKSVGLGANVAFGNGLRGSAYVGISELKSLTDMKANRFSFNLDLTGSVRKTTYTIGTTTQYWWDPVTNQPAYSLTFGISGG